MNGLFNTSFTKGKRSRSLVFANRITGMSDHGRVLLREKPNMQLQQRPATEADLPFLLSLRRETMEQHLNASGADTSDESHRARVLYHFDCASILMDAQSRPVGLLKVRRLPNEWEILQIQLGGALQGKGMGRAATSHRGRQARQGWRMRLKIQIAVLLILGSSLSDFVAAKEPASLDSAHAGESWDMATASRNLPKVVAPKYPEKERKEDIEGTTTLLMAHDERGRPTSVTVLTSSGNANLDAAALEAVKQWRVVPGTKGGKPAAGTVVIPIRFELSDPL